VRFEDKKRPPILGGPVFTGDRDRIIPLTRDEPLRLNAANRKPTGLALCDFTFPVAYESSAFISDWK